MPLYTFQCKCGRKGPHYAKIADRDQPRFCACGLEMQRIIDAPYVRPDIAPYQSPIDGRPINSRAQMLEDLKRSGSVQLEPGMKEEAERNNRLAKEKTMATVEASIDQTVAQMNASNYFSETV